MTDSRTHAYARAVVTLGALGGVLWWAAGPPRQALRAVSVAMPSEASDQFDSVLTHVAGALAWLCLGWFALVVALQLMALGSSRLAFACQRSVRLLAPRFMRDGARLLIGLTLLAGPLSSGVAMAAQPGSGSAPPTPAAAANLDRPATPDLDRPIGGLVAPIFAGPGTATTPALSSPAPPALTPPAPVESPTSGPRSADSAPEHLPLVTSSPHRASLDASGAYVVRRGDTLWDIAARHLGPHASAADIARAWPRWYAANRTAIGPNPALIHPGLVLSVPPD